MSNNGSDGSSNNDGKKRYNRKMLFRLSIAALVMFGFGFALVPFYEAFCKATGINNLLKPDIASAAGSVVDTSRTITLELDANTNNLAWTFRPLKRHVDIHPGELVRIDYEVANNNEYDMTGQAVPSYGPANAGEYVQKLECFCFSQQKLKAGESKVMPVVFVLKPDVPKDINTITLSYTFFEVAGTRAPAHQH